MPPIGLTMSSTHRDGLSLKASYTTQEVRGFPRTHFLGKH